MKQYLDLLQDILNNGVESDDRTGTGTLSVFGRQMRFDLSKGFPLLTTKKLHFKSIAIELLWFLSGNTNTKFLTDNGVAIWDEWSEKEDVYDHDGKTLIKRKGDLGPLYGEQWRAWKDRYGRSHDQISNVIKSIKEDPYSRRHIVNVWNVGELDKMNLQPCHYTFQFYVRNGKLSCMYTMRSNDFFLGSPYNIASYALLTHMIAHVCGLEVGELIYSGGDVHLYTNHIEQAKLQLTREPKPLPTLKFARDVKDIDDFKFEDFIIENYEAHPHIKGDVAV